MTPALLHRLRQVDTPTVCNAIEVAQGRRGFTGFTCGTVLCSVPQSPAIVGFACTARIAGQQPPTDPPEAVRALRMAYYKAMAEAPKPSVAVIEDSDFPHCVGAFWGEINVAVHKGFGLSGAVTNGVMRDLGESPDDFPVIAGSVGPSHAFVHVTEIGGAVDLFGLRVCNGDLIHADRHGAVVIPDAVLPGLEQALDTLHRTEQLVLGPAYREDFNFEIFEKAWAAFEKSRT